MFLVQGRTGAGKSSILDAVVYALFNNAPRYRSAAPLQLRSHHCSTDDPTWVELEFSSDGRRYRVRRTPEYERPKSRGEGLTTERPTAHLWRLDASGWTALEASVRTVAQALDEILPLSCQQFLQVVLLAQGEFARFLVADSAERKTLLGALFDTSRFESFDRLLQARVASRRGEIERAASATDVVVEQLVLHLATDRPEEPDEEWLALLHGTTAQAVAEAEEARAAARRLLDERRSEWEGARALLALQQRRDSLLATLARLDEQASRVGEARRVVARAEASEAVRPAARRASGSTCACATNVMRWPRPRRPTRRCTASRSRRSSPTSVTTWWSGSPPPDRPSSWSPASPRSGRSRTRSRAGSRSSATSSGRSSTDWPSTARSSSARPRPAWTRPARWCWS
ncbi:SMC family ATPase [Nocardioides daphniae]|uniref:Nuclease SbcCD subunit C n=1 Tax=Nocardioides daphniae TaxID=402297 RepID=A0A4P7UAT0_9ACTN|nr:SMC family ATPase [Nocardioides daphniae]